jgi:glycosyltransferase involved in cell wall biosynthesis
MQCPSADKLPSPPQDTTGWPWNEETTIFPESTQNGKPWPIISIVTPSLNQANFLEQTIRSVLLQGYPNLEYIIIDGGSTDGSVEIIQKYAQWLDYWVSERDSGQAEAINKGFHVARGKIFGWLNADDFLLPRAVYRVIVEYNKHPDAVAWVGNCYRIDPTGRILDVIIPRGLTKDCIAKWYDCGFFYQPSCFFASWAWNRCGPLDQELNIALDFDLWLKLADLGNFIRVPYFLSAATIHPSAKTQKLHNEMHIETAIVQIKHGYTNYAIERLNLVHKKQTIKDQLLKKLKKLIKHWGIYPKRQYWYDNFRSENYT